MARCDCLRPKAILPVLWLNAGERLRRSPLGVNHHGQHSVTDDEPRLSDRVNSAVRGSTRLLWGTRTVGHKRLLRTRCRGEVRWRRGMRMRVGHSIAGGQEVDVLRVTSLESASADDLVDAAVQETAVQLGHGRRTATESSSMRTVWDSNHLGSPKPLYFKRLHQH